MNQKKQLSLDDQFVAAKGMALIAKEIDGMQDGSPEKEAAKAKFKDKYDSFMSAHDMPLIETSPFSFHPNPLKIADYGSGLIRTGVGESALAAAGKNTFPGAAERVARAVNPLDRPALGMREYMDLGGVGDMGSLQDAEGGYKVTGKGAAGFAGDMLMNPAMLAGGLKSLLSRGATEAAAPPITADVMREAEQMMKTRAAGEMSPGLTMESLKNGLKTAGSASMDQLSALRDLMLKLRFKNADQAVQMAEDGGRIVTRPAPSQIFQESGAKGITSRQIRQDMRAMVNQNGQAVDRMGNEVAGITDLGITRGTPEMAVNPTSFDKESAMYPLYSPEQAARERTPFMAKEARSARQQLEGEFRAAAEGDPGIVRQAEENANQAGDVVQGPNGEILRDKQQFLPGMQPKNPITTNIERVKRNPTTGDWERVQEPVTMNTQDEISVRGRGSPDPLSVDEFYPLPKVGQMASMAQSKAAERKFFTSRDRFSPDAPQTPPVTKEQLAAEGGLYGEMGGHLRGLQEDLLDQARPGLGGDAHRINQRTSSLLEGGSYLDRPKPMPAAGKATSRSKQAFGGVPMAMVNGVTDAAKPLMMGTYQALSSPWIRQGALPAARAMWLENYWNNEYKPTEDNPWGLIRKYGAQQ
jgi:hypothetical protein